MSYKTLKAISLELSPKSISQAIREVKAFRDELRAKCLELVRALSEEGVKIAKMQVISMDAVDTGELEHSIDAVFFPQERCGIIYADCPYAVYVEYGTGVVGAANPHPGIGEGNLGGVYSIGGKNNDKTHVHMGYGRSFSSDEETGETKSTNSSMGWVYKDRNGRFFFTRGYPSRPFLYNTLRWLEEHAPDRASEILT
jgi:hypothetical protein